jgi:hypothetical protein
MLNGKGNGEALYLVFMPMGGTGLFGLKGGPGIMVNAFIFNSPYGIVTTLAVAALAGGVGCRPGAGDSKLVRHE